MRKQIVLHRVLALALCLALLLPAASFLSRAETTSWQVIKNSVRVRTGPGTNYATVKRGDSDLYLNIGHSVTVTGDPSEPDGSGYRWYPVTFLYSGSTYSGYIREDLIGEVTIPEPGAPNLNFEEQLALFPESYRPYLVALHDAHPSWNFEAVYTNLDWNTVQGEENKIGWSVIEKLSNVPLSYLSTAQGCYNWETDTYIPQEGKNWFQAAPEVVAYYMDPRNFLNDTDIFQFEKLSYDGSLQTPEGIRAMLSGSFLDGGSTVDLAGNDISYVNTFASAAATFNVSAYHLIARCFQEVGKRGTGAGAKGTNSTYPGIYNFFNIGASTGAMKGLEYASKTDDDSFRPWNTQYKAIFGGAKFLANSFIQIGQDTLYFQKFSVVGNKLYWHQYMSNIQAPYSEGRTMRSNYSKNGLLETGFVFRIPIFNNMPASPCSLPASAGSPNANLASLSIAGYDFEETFDPNRTEYHVSLPDNLEQIQVSAAPVSSTARVEGNVGVVYLGASTSRLTVLCTSSSGEMKTYVIWVTSYVGASGWEPLLNFWDGFIIGIDPGTTASDFTAPGNLNLYGKATATLLNENGAVVTGGLVKTGQILRYYDGESATDFTLVIYGDVSPDGKIDAADTAALREILLEKVSPGFAVLAACDVDHDGDTDAADLLLLHKATQGQARIEPVG